MTTPRPTTETTETIDRRRYPLFLQRVRVLPIPDLTGEVCGVMRFAGGGFRYTVRLDLPESATLADGQPCIREFSPEQLEPLASLTPQ